MKQLKLRESFITKHGLFRYQLTKMILHPRSRTQMISFKSVKRIFNGSN